MSCESGSISSGGEASAIPLIDLVSQYPENQEYFFIRPKCLYAEKKILEILQAREIKELHATIRENDQDFLMYAVKREYHNYFVLIPENAKNALFFVYRLKKETGEFEEVWGNS